MYVWEVGHESHITWCQIHEELVVMVVDPHIIEEERNRWALFELTVFVHKPKEDNVVLFPHHCLQLRD